jgi:hypothetical protein
MKMQVCGIEISEGTSKAGKPYSIGRLHTLIPLAPPMASNDPNVKNVAKGIVGTTYDCDVVLLRKLEHLPFPLDAEVTVSPIQRFGKREEVVTDVRPLELIKKAA